VEYLYSKGADINAVNEVTFIICIIMSVFIVLIFIRSRIIYYDYTIYILYILQDGTTPLHDAANRGYINILIYLHSKGANINDVTKVIHILINYYL